MLTSVGVKIVYFCGLVLKFFLMCLIQLVFVLLLCGGDYSFKIGNLLDFSFSSRGVLHPLQDLAKKVTNQFTSIDAKQHQYR
jgi:hypothetical protein